MADSFYSEKEAQEILSKAARRSGGGEGMTRARLIEAAGEMGISAADVIAAEEEVKAAQQARTDRKEFVNKRKRQFLGSISSSFGTCVFFFGLVCILEGGLVNPLQTWAIWPCGFALINVVKTAFEFFASMTAAGDDEFERWVAKRRAKEQGLEFGEQTSSHRDIARGALAENPDAKINAIKVVRERTGLGLKEAKDLVDSVEAESRYVRMAPAPSPMPPLPLPEIARRALAETGGDKGRAIELVYQRAGVGLTEAVAIIDELTLESRLQH